MQTTKMNLTDLVRPEQNVRIHTKKQIEEFVRSIKMFGQIRPIVVDENNTVLAGNGLLEALQAMGETTADVLVFSNLTENDKKKLMISDNKIFNLGTDNLDVFYKMIEELHLTGDDLQVPGYDEDILRTLVADAEAVTEKIATYGILGEDKINEIKEGTVRREEQDQRREEREEAQATSAPQPQPQNTAPYTEPTSMPPQQNAETSYQQSAPPEHEPQPIAQVETARTVCCPHCNKEFTLV